MKVVYIGASWPQPTMTAAGCRTVGMVQCLLNLGHKVTFMSYKKPNSSQMTAIRRTGVETQYCPPNDEAQFVAAVGQPDVCVMERFMTEEMFGHYLYAHCPGCVRVLDTQDLHCLRTQRETMAGRQATIGGRA